jgi:ribosome-associated toxin RatA of RatAB toxin-antitoxin module
MITVSRQALVAYGAAEMYELVEDVEAYPRFLPWCSAVEVEVREPERTVATIHVDFRGVRQSFTTANAQRHAERISMQLVRGPFRHLHGEWRFAPLGEAGSRIELDLAYELASPVLARLAGPVFNHIANTFVDAFVRRADALHLRAQ